MMLHWGQQYREFASVMEVVKHEPSVVWLRLGCVAVHTARIPRRPIWEHLQRYVDSAIEHKFNQTFTDVCSIVHCSCRCTSQPRVVRLTHWDDGDMRLQYQNHQTSHNYVSQGLDMSLSICRNRPSTSTNTWNVRAILLARWAITNTCVAAQPQLYIRNVYDSRIMQHTHICGPHCITASLAKLGQYTGNPMCSQLKMLPHRTMARCHEGRRTMLR